MRPLIVLVLALTVPHLQAAAASSDLPLRDYVHTVWTQHDGVPLGFVQKIFQTTDGYLWVATRDDLLRFDGMRFVRTSTPCTQRMANAASAPDGGFWLICGNRLLRRTGGGHFIEVPQTFLQPMPGEWGVFVDRMGRPWIYGDSIRYLEPDGTGGREIAGLTASRIRAAVQDSNGTLWVSDGHQVIHVHEDYKESIALQGVVWMTGARDGGVFAAADNRIWHLRRGSTPSAISAPLAVTLSNIYGSMSEAADGGLWVGTRRHGVALLRNGHIETAPGNGELDRLVAQVFVDREGTIWAGATSGLHRFRKPMVELMSPASGRLTGVPSFVFVDSQENVWTGPGDKRGVSQMNSKGGTAQFVASQGEPYSAVGEDETGRIWLSNERDIGYVANGEFVAVRDAANAPVADVYSFKQDGRGQLWAVAQSVGVYRVTPGPPRLVVKSPGAAADFLVSERFGIWVAGMRSVEQHVDGRTNIFPGESPDLSKDVARTIFEDGDSIWTGTFRSLRRWRNGRWTTWTRVHGLPGDGVVEEIAADWFGRFWIMTGAGLLMLPRQQLDATPDGLPRALSFARIGLLDGVTTHPGGMRSSPRASSDRHGRLYFATLDSVMIVDPSAVTQSSLSPPIVLESVTIDNRAIDLTTTESFVEPSRVQFDYTSLSLRSPENARFRYRLEGYDRDWVEAGGQRHVTYGSLRPGPYRFRVIGAGSEGVWNEQGASFAFHIAPVFWRTWWFQMTLLVFGSLLVVGFHRLRVRQLTRQFDIGLDARVSERMHLAGELHDGIMQQISALTLMLGTARRKIQSDLEAKVEIGDVQKKLVQVGTELRQLSHDLHPASLKHGGLPDTLRTYCGEFSRVRGLSVSCDADDDVRELSLGAALALYRIAQEAMGNAVKHGAAERVDLRLTRSNARVTLSVTDDGKGLDANRIGGSGGLGLINMRERARQLNGTFDLKSRPGHGTTVAVTIPFRPAE